MKYKKALLGLSFIFCLQLQASPAIQPEYQQLVSNDAAREDIKLFASEMAKKHQFDESKLFNLLSNMEHDQDIIRKMTRPAESVMPWFSYQKIWMKQQRFDEGVEFWRKNAAALTKAEQVYGVDPAIIVAIIGVETFYGRIQGTHSVLSALHTLGFYYPKRATFFRSELAEYLLLARKEGWQLEQIKGSYAGAMGMGQFISSSYSHYAVDFNQDGKTDLFNDPVDMIGSVANYFKQHKWRKDGFVAKPIILAEEQKKLVQTDLKPVHLLDELKAAKIDISDLNNKSNLAAIYQFESAEGEFEYWLAGENFYTITRYNHSAMYALAVFQVSQAIQAKMQSEKM